jgi:hypothetical protein
VGVSAMLVECPGLRPAANRNFAIASRMTSGMRYSFTGLHLSERQVFQMLARVQADAHQDQACQNHDVQAHCEKNEEHQVLFFEHVIAPCGV